MCASGGGGRSFKYMNAVIEQFTALQKYLWIPKTNQTLPVDSMEGKVQYIHRLISTPTATAKSQMGTTLNTEVSTGLLPNARLGNEQRPLQLRSISGFWMIVDEYVRLNVALAAEAKRCWATGGRRLPSIALFVHFLKSRQEVGDGVHHVVGHQAAVGGQLAVPVLVGVLELRHAGEGEHGVQAAVGPEQHVRLQAVPDHQALGGLRPAELAGDALEHEAARLADHGGLAARGHLQGRGEGPGTFPGERGGVKMTQKKLDQLKHVLFSNNLPVGVA